MITVVAQCADGAAEKHLGQGVVVAHQAGSVGPLLYRGDVRMTVECPSCSARPWLSCVTGSGDARFPHARRLLVAAVAAAVELLWRLLPERERGRLVLEMVSEPHFSDVEQHDATDAAPRLIRVPNRTGTICGANCWRRL